MSGSLVLNDFAHYALKISKWIAAWFEFKPSPVSSYVCGYPEILELSLATDRRDEHVLDRWHLCWFVCNYGGFFI